MLLEIPNGNTPEEGTYVSSCYMDATEVCNVHYRSFLQWNAIVYATLPEVYESLLPDTSIWLEHFPEEAIGGLLKEYYFRNAAFDYHPVVGVSWGQAQAYALWRTDRINELILLDRKHIIADFERQQGANNFITFNFLNGLYTVSPNDKSMINPITKEERRVVASDEILLPNYRLPTPAELKQAAKKEKDYSKNNALIAYKKKILAHNSIHPKPAYYDHKQYSLPYSIIKDGIEGAKAPYHLKDTLGEWTQLHYTTNEQYNKSHYRGRDADGRLTYYISMWVTQSQMVRFDSTTTVWNRRFEVKLDTTITNKFAQQHTILNTTPFKPFRCVLPNLW